MIIETGASCVFLVRFEYTDAHGAGELDTKAAECRVRIQDPVTGQYGDVIVAVKKLPDNTWPAYLELDKIVKRALKASPNSSFATILATRLGWQLGVVPFGHEPGWKTPMERGTGWICTSGPPPIAGQEIAVRPQGAGQRRMSGPLIIAVAQPGLSDDQIRSAATAATVRLASCLG